MTGPAPSKLERLVHLAKETSSDTRRDLLRQMTDVFMESPEDHTEAETEHFDTILTQVAADVEVALRTELAERLADVDAAPKGLINQLARDDFSVAEPVLSRSSVLSDDDLVDIVRERGMEHMNAIATRPTVSPAVSDEIVERGDMGVLRSLAGNDGARFSQQGAVRIADRSVGDEQLQNALVSRADLPTEVVEKVYTQISETVRREVAASSDSLTPGMIDRLIAQSKEAIVKSAKADPLADAGAQRAIQNHIAARTLNEPVMVTYLERKMLPEFLLAFAHLVGVDKETAQRILRDRSCEAAAVACRAAQFETTTFNAIMDLLGGASNRDARQARKMLSLYDQITVETAQRVMRFWKVRKQSADPAPAKPAVRLRKTAVA